MLNFLKFFHTKSKLAILMYHHIGPVTDEKERKYFISPEMFEKQICLIKEKGYYALRLEEVEEAYFQKKTLPEKSVLITLDDGWLDNYTYAFPLAKKHNIPITIFLSTALIGKEDQLLNWEQVKEMHESGQVSFSSHGAHHKRLRDLSDEEVLSELNESKNMLEDFFSSPVYSFCYPFGACDKRVRGLFKQTDYIFDFGTRKGLNNWPWNGRKPLLRAHVFNDESLKDFENELKRGRK